MKNHTVYTVTKSSMITGNRVKSVDFTSLKEAMTYFNEIVSDLVYEYKELDNGFLEAGGIGHDFRIELEWNNF